LNLQRLFKAEITLAAPQELGETPQGRRRIIGITGGRFSGERLSGRVLPGGADWQLIRADGVADLDPALYYMRTTPRFETGDTRYAWLNRIVCVATGARRAAAVELEVFEVQ
jgi:hypothetical protein